MRYKIIVFLLSLFIYWNSNAQVDILQPPTEPEKKEVTRILKEYENFIRITGDSALAKKDKAAASLKFVKELYNSDVQVLNDLDTVSKEDKFLKFFSYAQQIPVVFPQTIVPSLSTIQLSKVKYDKWRRYHYIEANAVKKIEWYKKRSMVLHDSVSGKDSIVYDSLKYGYSKKLTFYIRFDKVNGVSKNFKLFGIGRQGGEFKLEPLPPAVTWWIEMDPQWKAYFREKLKLEEYPASYQIEGVTAMREIDISGKPFKSLEPLRKMVFLSKLNCSGTLIESVEPLSQVQTLTVLNVSSSKLASLQGIEKLTNLTELYCTGLKLKSIEPVKGLVNLIKFDCSENELEDLSPVAELINLKELDFSSNVTMESIDAVKNLVNLEKLRMQKVKVKTIEPLRKLVNLIHLDCFNTEISSLEPIRNHQKIINLNIDHNPITTLEPIKEYKFVLSLSLSTSSVTDLSPIKNYVNLRELSIGNTQIVTLGPVQKLEFIRILKCQMTKIPKEEVARFKKNHPGCDITYFY